MKGASLCELFSLNLPVPYAFIISNDLSSEYFHGNLNEVPVHTVDEMKKCILEIEKDTGKEFGSASGPFPLLFSVRGSTPVVLPPWKNVPLMASQLKSVGLPDSFSIPGCILN